MSTYLFRCKKGLFWQTHKVTGHKLEGSDLMVLFKEDGGIETIPQWSKYKMRLETDWVAHVKKSTEAKTGVDLKTTV